MNKSKNIGTSGESAVVRYLVAHGFPHAERAALAGANDRGDCTGLGPVCIEVKSGHKAEEAGDALVAAWIRETETERQNANADVGLLVMKRAGHGYARVGSWWAVMTLADLTLLTGESCDCEPRTFWGLVGASTPIRMHLSAAVELLRRAGYGDPMPDGRVA